MHIYKTNKIVEPGAQKIAFAGDGDKSSELVAVDFTTPADVIMEQEESDPLAHVIHSANLEIVSRLLVALFGENKNPKDAIIKLVLICYVVAPHLLAKNDLASIAAEYGTTKQVLSYHLLKINKDLGLRSRNQKSDTARESYSEHTKAWHKARASGVEPVKDDLAPASFPQLELTPEEKKQRLADAKRLAEEKYNQRAMEEAKPQETITMKKEISPETSARLAAAARKRWEIHRAKKEASAKAIATPAVKQKPAKPAVAKVTKPRASKRKQTAIAPVKAKPTLLQKIFRFIRIPIF